MSGFTVQKADYAGACYGVQRALQLTQNAAAENESVCTLGPLIHNPRVVNQLAEQGIAVAQNPDEITHTSVVIRSHGVKPQVLDDLKNRGLTVINATCPHVMRAQKAAATLANQGKFVIVIGEAGHPEVESISEHARVAGGECIIVGSVEDLPQHLPEPVGVVVQTTQPKSKLEEIVQNLEARGIKPEVKDTICFATQQRQQAAIDLSHKVDVMLVLGGRNSSNTTRLYELCAENCPAAYHIESPEEIDPQWFDGVTSIGVTAGASTPEEQIDAVLSYLNELS